MTRPTAQELPAHGGNLAEIARTFGVDEERLIDFSASINPFGIPESVKRVIERGAELLLHYPDPECEELRDALAERHGCSPASILVGNGSNEIIYLLCQMLRPRSALVLHPTFSEYERALALVSCDTKHVIATEDKEFAHPLAEAQSSAGGADAVFVCNPNNPTGVLASRTEILDLARSLPESLVVVDEAFIDFVALHREASCVDAVERAGNLLLLRSLTKFYAIPGLRLGYAVGSPGLIEKLRSFKEPWSVNAIAQMAGIAALGEHDYAERTRKLVAEERAALLDGLGRTPQLQPFPSSANFVMVKVVSPGLTADELRLALIPQGIVIRHCSNFPGLGPDYFRVAVRRAEENQALLDALGAALAAGIHPPKRIE